MLSLHAARLRPRRHHPTLAAKVAFLSRADCYGLAGASVTAIETHMSWVFLSGEHAYKLKKPVRRGSLDYRTLGRRRRSCLGEVRLNRRLAPDAYLGVVALTLDGEGRLALAGNGQTVEWLVWMRRLPEALSLERQLLEAQATPEAPQAIVARLAPFYAGARHASWSVAGHRRRRLAAIALAERELVRPQYAMDVLCVHRLADALRHRTVRMGGELDARVCGRRIVDGHGDLRPEHIYLTTPPTIIDCIEFDRSLRLRDPVDELAFLAMEAERLGHPEIDGALFAAWRELAGDGPSRALIDYYKAQHAFVRAQIAVWHMDDGAVDERDRWISVGSDYLRRATAYLQAS